MAAGGLAGISLSFYLHRPQLDITLRDLEEACLKRQRLLGDVEIFNEVANETTNETEPKAEFPMRDKDKEAGFIASAATVEILKERGPELDAEARKKDEASHFLLKLVYCTSSDQCKWFVRHERDLFLKRLEKYLLPREMNEFLRTSLGFSYAVKVECNELTRVSTEEYKVPLHHATHLLLGKDALFPRGGFVSVPGDQLKFVAARLFEDLLEYSIQSVQSRSEEINEDDRIAALVKHLRSPGSSVVPRPMDSKTKLSLEQLEPSTRHFPPCMKVLHHNLKKDHHLKHYGRLQFGLFLKAIGLSFEDSLKFWKGEFCQKMTPDKFHKEYEYNIRHSYGKVGKMVDYTASGCSKLAHMPKPAAQEHHGCPFRHCERDELARTLLTYGLNPLELEPILEKADSHPQVSCIRLFKSMHKGVPESATNHIGHYPAAFYEASRRVEMG